MHMGIQVFAVTVDAIVQLIRYSSVLKYTFYYSGVTKPTDQKMMAIEKRVCYIHRSQEKGARHALEGHKGKCQGHP